MLRDLLVAEDYPVGRKHVALLIVRVRIEALMRRKSTSGKHPGRAIYPYLLRGMKIERPNHACALDRRTPDAEYFAACELKAGA